MSPDPPVSSSDSADERNPTIPLASEDATQASPSGRHPDSVPRGSIAGYELVRELHRGGQGVVYQAIQDATKRKVAIKVLLEGPYASPAAKRRFEREIELAASLKHANIISVFHSGQTDEGRQFCAMEYVRGVPICEYVRHKTLTLEETLGLFQDVCDAVNYAHQKGVIHRDLKPSNILVDTEGAPKLLDFGLSKMVGGAEQTLISMTGQVMGTLPYMSPEQTRGNPDEIDIRTDVYALGVILYQMLTGRVSVPGRRADERGAQAHRRDTTDAAQPRVAGRGGCGQTLGQTAAARRMPYRRRVGNRCFEGPLEGTRAPLPERR